MVIDAPTRWSSVVDSFGGSCRFLADARGPSLAQLRETPIGHPVILAVGPEGGFTPAEREHAVRSGWLPVKLSTNTLRTETAALAGVAALLSRAKEPSE
jgi:16S rRNA (uracil1498-N3)-methyltransferase